LYPVAQGGQGKFSSDCCCRCRCRWQCLNFANGNTALVNTIKKFWRDFISSLL
jgi:hypothetical protein